MKRKLHSQIKALANEILSSLQADEMGSARSMKKAASKLYEQLTVLEYLESQILGEVEPQESESMDSKSFREQNWFKEPEPVPQPEHKEELVEPLMEKIKDIVAQMPEESQQVDDLLEEVLPKKEYIKNDLEEFAANYKDIPIFERKESEMKTETITASIDPLNDPIPQEVEVEEPTPPVAIQTEEKPRSLNDKLHKGLNVGLNDRLAFIKHLFDGKTEDYTRVLSQISSMNSFDEASTFIKGKVKPDYNYWLKKDEFADRFMAIVEKSFN